ncbi:MAG: DUF4129 domain-containing protein [Armatimonadetes bacterium]|nr:DUF4129 domain-containing protein [Armatimonadota bacterium]
MSEIARLTPILIGTTQANTGAERALQVKTALAQILSKPEFQYRVSVWDRIMMLINHSFQFILMAIIRFLHHLASALPFVGHSGYYLMWILLGLIILILGVVIAVSYRRFSGKLNRNAMSLPDIAELTPDIRDSILWYQRAAGFADQQNYREAFRYTFNAVLLRLDQYDMIRYDPSRSNGEYIREINRNERLYGRFASLVRRFDRCWYGNHPATESDYRNAVELYEELPAALGTVTEPAAQPA